MAAKKIIVVGGGIIGTTLSFRLAEAGASVIQLERGWPGGLTTSNGLGLVTAQKARPRPHFDLNMMAMAAHRRLAAQLGNGTWWNVGGSLEHIPANALSKLEKLVDLWCGLGYRTRIVDGKEAKRIEPDIMFRDDETAFVYAPDDGFVFPMELMGRLIRAGREIGVDLRTGIEVEDFVSENGKTTGVVTKSGETLVADLVILCAGPVTRSLSAKLDYDLPLIEPGQSQDSGAGYTRQVNGMLVAISKMPAVMRGFIRLPEIQIRPEGAGRFMLQGLDLERELTHDVPPYPFPPQAEVLIERARSRLPFLDGARVESVFRGTRVITSDALPVVGHLPGNEGSYVVIPHAGIAQSAALAELVAAEIVFDIESPMLAPFRPTRFADAEAMQATAEAVTHWAGGRHE